MIACSSLPLNKPLSPTAKVASIEIVKLGFNEQELAFKLEVFNPNTFDLPVNLLEFIASSGDQTMASGRTTEPALLSAKSNTEVIVNVTARANRLLRQLIASSLSENPTLDYNVAGFVKLDNWPARIPFDVDKSL